VKLDLFLMGRIEMKFFIFDFFKSKIFYILPNSHSTSWKLCVFFLPFFVLACSILFQFALESYRIEERKTTKLIKDFISILRVEGFIFLLSLQFFQFFTISSRRSSTLFLLAFVFCCEKGSKC
jgi:hypothetical protein